jgi:hypothetical protein
LAPSSCSSLSSRLRKLIFVAGVGKHDKHDISLRIQPYLLSLPLAG